MSDFVVGSYLPFFYQILESTVGSNSDFDWPEFIFYPIKVINTYSDINHLCVCNVSLCAPQELAWIFTNYPRC